MQNLKTLSTITLGAGTLFLSGCAAIDTEIQHGSLQTSTKMSNTIFLPPMASDQKNIFVEAKNTSDQDVDISSLLDQDLQAKGYTIVQDPSQANEILQVNILQAGKIEQSDLDAALADGFGGALVGATAGALVAGGNDALTGAGVGALAGGAVSSLADTLVKDVTYSMITDVQVSVQLQNGQSVQQTTTSNLQQGTATQVSTTSSVQTNMQQYQTRVISYADKVNLSFDDAKPTLEQNLASEIANIF